MTIDKMEEWAKDLSRIQTDDYAERPRPAGGKSLYSHECFIRYLYLQGLDPDQAKALWDYCWSHNITLDDAIDQRLT